MGCHSVIDSPDSVSRVMPPSTTMMAIIAAQMKSHAAMTRRSPADRFSTSMWDKSSSPVVLPPEADGAASDWQGARAASGGVPHHRTSFGASPGVDGFLYQNRRN